MTQNMFQEGLYHVFFKETPSPRPLAQVTNQGELVNVRIHRWFGTVVSTRLLVAGVRRLLHVLVPVFYWCLLYSGVCFRSGGADPQCHGLHICHSHSCMRELQLLSRPVHTCVVEPHRKSTSVPTDMHTARLIPCTNPCCVYSILLQGVWP